MTPPVWIREHGVRACLCTVGVCRERKRSGSKSAERASEERRGSGQWLGSDQTEPSHKRRIQMCLYLARLPFLSFPLPFLRHAFHLARARGRLVLFTLLIVIAWTVTQAQPLGTLPSTVSSLLDRLSSAIQIAARHATTETFSTPIVARLSCSDYTGRSRWRPRIDGTNFRGDLLPESNDNWPDRRANNAIFIIGKRYSILIV